MQSGDWRTRPHRLHYRRRPLGRQDQSGGVGFASFSLLYKKKEIGISVKKLFKEKKKKFYSPTEPNLVSRLR